MEKTAFEPGESGQLKAYFQSNAFKGRVSKNIRVKTNTPHRRFVSVSFSAEVDRDLIPTSTGIMFEDVKPDRTYVVEMPVEVKMEKPLEVLAVDIQGDQTVLKQFPITVSHKIGTDKEDIFVFELKTGKKLPAIDRPVFDISIKTNATLNEILKFYVRIQMTKLIDVDPLSLFAFGVKANQQKARRIRVQSNTDQPLQVLSVDCDLDFLTFDVEQESSRRSFIWLNVKQPDDADGTEKHQKTGNFQSVINIQVQLGNEPHTVSLTVRGSLALN